jgi:hypothetical protein
MLRPVLTSGNKKYSDFVLTIEYAQKKKSDGTTEWLPLQIIRIPKGKVSEIRARRLLDQAVEGFTLQNLTVRGTLSVGRYTSEAIAVSSAVVDAPELSALRSDSMPGLSGSGAVPVSYDEVDRQPVRHDAGDLEPAKPIESDAFEDFEE